jgi:peptidyl-prolyl cis-trans isomerase D
MLQTFRSIFGSKIGAGIALGFLVLIAIAFASGDIANNSSFGGVAGGDRVATVGKERIDSSALSQGATAAVERLKQENPRLSMQGFLVNGGLEKVLDDLIARTAVLAFGKKHGVVASDRLIDSEIAQIAAFKGPDGKFNQEAFRQAIQQRGVSEALVRQDIAQSLVAKQLLVPAAFSAVVPREMAKRYTALLKDRRIGTVAVLPSALFAPQKPPTDQELATFYGSQRTRFIRPERRVIRYAAFDEASLKPAAAPTEAEIAARFNAGKAQYGALETRRVTQLIVPTEAAAKAIAAEVSGGKTLEAAATGKGLETASLGAVSKTALAGQASQTVADAVFAASKGTIAAPARSGLGWHLMRIDAVEVRPARTLDQARSEITAQLTDAKRRSAVSDLLSQIEDSFDEGGSLVDAAKKLGVQLQQTPPITADGQAYGVAGPGAPPVLARVLQTAFSMEQQNEPQIAEVEAGKTFVIFDVSQIAASAPAPLKEIRGDVAAAYMIDKGFNAARDAARKIQAEVRKGADLGKALAALGRPLPPAQNVSMDRNELSRLGRQGEVPPALALFFSMAEGTVKILPAPQDRAWFVVYLKDIEAPPVADDDPLIAATMRELGTMTGDEYVEALRTAITKEIGVERNATAVKAVRQQLGGGAN